MTESFVDPVELKMKKQEDVTDLHPGDPSWEGGDSIRARSVGQPNEGATQQGVRLEDAQAGGGPSSEKEGAKTAPNLYKDVGQLNETSGSKQ
ncbi:hypothetical protein JCM9279_005888 [Rhodotorula babjevae]